MMMMTTLEYDEIKPHKVTYRQEKAKKERRRYLGWISKNLNHPKKHLSPSTYVEFASSITTFRTSKTFVWIMPKTVNMKMPSFRLSTVGFVMIEKKSTLITFGNKMSYQVNMSTSTLLCISNRQEKSAHKNAWNACLSNEIFNNIINFSSYIHENTLHYGNYFGCSLHRTSFIQ